MAAVLAADASIHNTLESLDLGHTIWYQSDADRAQCWRWLAFALFAPRPRKFARVATTAPLSITLDDTFALTDCLAFIAVLNDPAGALVHGHVWDHNDRSYERDFVLCTAAAGAVFYGNETHSSGDGRSNAVVHTLVRQTELEAVCWEPPTPASGADAEPITSDGWTCMVLPGIGLGWVQNTSILRTEREGNTATVADLQHQRAIDLTWSWFSASQTMLFEHVGPRLRGLTLGFSRNVYGMDMSAVLAHCPRLQRLRLYGNELYDENVTEVFAALEGELGDHLRSLQLDDNWIDASMLERLLAHRTPRPALLELRIQGVKNDDVDTLTRALRGNHTLQVLELKRAHQNNHCDYAAFHQQLHDELLLSIPLPLPLPLPQRVAFLSVVRHPLTRQRHKLDSFIVATVFAFASFVSVRRRVVCPAHEREGNEIRPMIGQLR